MSRERAVGAGAWSALDIILRQGVQFIVSVVLARLLVPTDFGLIALLTFFTSLSVTFVQGGLTMALIQRQDSSHEQENAVFWCNLAATTVFCAILIAISPLVAGFYEQPVLAPLMLAAAGQVFLSAASAVQTALLSRALRFDRLTVAGIVSSLASGVSGIAAALAGWGVWALASHLLVAAGTNTLMLWLLSEWKPSLRIRWSAVSSFLRFGAHISLSSFLEVVYSYGFLLVLGKAYGLRDLGIWNRAAGVTGLPTGIISQVISRTALPLLAARADEPDALRRGLQSAIGMSMLLSLPLMAGLALLSDLVIEVLFGPKWLDAAPLLSIIVIGSIVLPLQILNLQLIIATGKSRAFLKLEVQKKIGGVIILGIGCWIGLIGFAWATVIFSAFTLVINSRPTAASIGYGLSRQLRDIRGIFFSAGVMSLVVYLLRDAFSVAAVLKLGILTVAGGMVYIGTGLTFRVNAFLEGTAVAKMLYKKVAGRSSFRKLAE